MAVLNFHVIQCTTYYLFSVLNISACRSVTFSSRLLFDRIHLEGFLGHSPEEIIRKRLGGMRRKIEWCWFCLHVLVKRDSCAFFFDLYVCCMLLAWQYLIKVEMTIILVLFPALSRRALSLSTLVLVIFKTLKLSFLRQGKHSYLLILGFSMWTDAKCCQTLHLIIKW